MRRDRSHIRREIDRRCQLYIIIIDSDADETGPDRDVGLDHVKQSVGRRAHRRFY